MIISSLFLFNQICCLLKTETIHSTPAGRFKITSTRCNEHFWGFLLSNCKIAIHFLKFWVSECWTSTFSSPFSGLFWIDASGGLWRSWSRALIHWSTAWVRWSVVAPKTSKKRTSEKHKWLIAQKSRNLFLFLFVIFMLNFNPFCWPFVPRHTKEDASGLTWWNKAWETQVTQLITWHDTLWHIMAITCYYYMFIVYHCIICQKKYTI